MPCKDPIARARKNMAVAAAKVSNLMTPLISSFFFFFPQGGTVLWKALPVGLSVVFRGASQVSPKGAK